MCHLLGAFPDGIAKTNDTQLGWRDVIAHLTFPLNLLYYFVSAGYNYVFLESPRCLSCMVRQLYVCLPVWHAHTLSCPPPPPSPPYTLIVQCPKRLFLSFNCDVSIGCFHGVQLNSCMKRYLLHIALLLSHIVVLLVQINGNTPWPPWKVGWMQTYSHQH